MGKISLSEDELNDIKVGEPITLTVVLSVLAISIIMIIGYKLFTSSEGKTQVPGGWTFQWK